MKIKVGQQYEVGVEKNKCTVVSVDNGNIHFCYEGEEELTYLLTEKEFLSIATLITKEYNPIEPDHYNKGEIDLYESWYRTRPFNEFVAIMEAIIERYLKRDKFNPIEDLDKAAYTLKRLREYKVIEIKKRGKVNE